MLPKHEQIAPESRYVGEVEIDVRTLDSVFLPEWRSKGSVYLKIDTQGFEKQMLDGAAGSLRFIDTIQTEMSITPLYEGEMFFEEIYSRIKSEGYRLVEIEPGFSGLNSAEMLQFHATSHRFT